MADANRKLKYPSTIPFDSQSDLHMWQFSLQQQEQKTLLLKALLSREERAKSERFSTALLQCRFVAARASLRVIIASYLNAEPSEIEFEYGQFCKPAIKTKGASLQFNMAHSNDLGVIAITSEKHVGIDVEHVSTVVDMDNIVAHAFSPYERSVYSAIPADLRANVFLRCWTRKEAYMKATGMGLSLPPDKFDVTLIPGEIPRLLRVEHDPDEVSRWSLSDFDLATDYIGTVAFEGTFSSLRLFTFDAEQYCCSTSAC